MGISLQFPTRVVAAFYHVVQEAIHDGHCFLPSEMVIQKTLSMIHVSLELVENGILELSSQKRIASFEYEKKLCMSLMWMNEYERSSAVNIMTLLEINEDFFRNDSKEILVQQAEKKVGMTLALSQKEALMSVLGSKVSIITGGPGVGKTTVIRVLLEIFRQKDKKILLAAPTGRAAKRMNESTGFEARTIHRLLGYDPASRGFVRNQEVPLDCDVLIVDEFSMVDLALFYGILQALPLSSYLICVGDVDQLPSVGPGQVLRDLIESSCIHVAYLKEVFRQAAQSRIIMNSHRVNQGLMPLLALDKENSDFFYMKMEDNVGIMDTILNLVSKRLPSYYNFDSVKDIQVLTPMNKGDLGTQNLNKHMQLCLNPYLEKCIQKGQNKFALSDKVMVIKNNYEKEIFNGDIGFVKSINIEDSSLMVDFDGKEVEFENQDLDILTLAYACTIHKSQGSEYPVVVIPVSTSHFVMLKRNLLYTGMTRGKKLVILVGQERALKIAVQKCDASMRFTRLKSLMGDFCDENSEFSKSLTHFEEHDNFHDLEEDPF